MDTTFHMDVDMLEALLNQSHDAIFAWSHSSGILAWNHRAESLYGFTRLEALGQRPMELLQTRQISGPPSFVHALQQTGSWEGELEHIARDGRKIIVDSRQRQIHIDNEPCVIESNRDITEHKHDTELLRRDNARLRILSNIAEALLAARKPDDLMEDVYHQLARDLQLDGYFHFVVNADRTALELASSAGVPPEMMECAREVQFGHAICGAVASTREPLLAHDIQNSTHPRLEAVRYMGFRAYACYPLLNGKELLGTFSLASRQKDRFDSEDIDFIQTVTRYVVLATVRLRNEIALQQSQQQLRVTKAELEDYTRTLELRVAERTASLSQSVHSLEDLLYTIAHDLRAPNRALSGFAEILLRDHGPKLEDEAVELLEKIAAAATRNDRLIADVLKLGQLAHQELPCAPLKLERSVRCCVEIMKPDLERAGATVDIVPEWPEIWANESALRQILIQLLSNALQHADPKRPPVIRIWPEEEAADVKLCVGDNGPGIPSEHQEIIFRPFQRLHSGCHGTGIGLAIVRKAAERLGGSAGVHSDGPGKGSCFWVKLRKAQGSNPCPPVPDSHKQPTL